MFDSYALPVRPAPKDDESLLGYMQRLAEANRCESTSWIADRAGVQLRDAAYGKADLATLAAMCLLDVAALNQMTYAPVDDRVVSFKGHPLRSERVRNSAGQICGACLAEDGYRRAAWDLAFAGICPTHEVKLVDACQECGGELSWTVPSATKCRCGADLTKQRGGPVSAEDAAAVAEAISLFTDSSRSATGSWESGFPSLPPGEIIELALCLGRHELALATGTDQSGRAADGDLIPALRLGLQLVREWLRRLYALLDRHLYAGSKDEDSLTIGRGTPFDRLYQTICGLSGSGWSAVVHEAFRDYAWKNPGILFHKRSRIFEGLAESKGYVSVDEAARALHLDRNHLVDMLDLPEGQKIRSVRYEYMCFVNLADVTARAWEISGPIPLVEVGRRLGISKKAILQDIRDFGVFASTRPPRASGLRHGPLSTILGHDVDAFIERMDSIALQSGSVTQAVIFKGAVEQAKRHGVGTAQLLFMMKAEELKPAGFVEGGVGVHRYLFDLGEVKASLEAMTEKKTGTISIARAAERLRVRLDVAYDLVRKKLLCGKKHKRLTVKDVEVPPSMFSAPSRILPLSVARKLFESRVPHGLRIDVDALAAYEQEYIDVATLGRDLGVDTRILRKLVSELHPDLEACARVGALKTEIYRRDDLNLSALKRAARRRAQVRKQRRSVEKQAA